MNRIIVAAGIAAAAFAADIQAADAQVVYPFGSRPFCASGDYGVGSLPQCAFNTLAQCRASLQGVEHCYANPALGWAETHGGAAGKKTQNRRPRKKTSY